MREHLSNAAWGVLDYLAYPAAMLVAAPVLLHTLGVAQYGVWVVCTAAVSTGGIIASGFGDANIKYVAEQRTLGNSGALIRIVRSMVGINLVLGGVMAILALAVAPCLARHLVPAGSGLYLPCLWSLRIAGALMLVRAIESVCVSTQRAFDLYGRAVWISLTMRVATIALAAWLARLGYGVTSIMAGSFALLTVGTALQLVQMKRLVKAPTLLPTFDRIALAALMSFGIFSWLQAVSGVLFSQADRLVLGVSLGATAVTAYALCVQMAQPIYGIAASGLHFLFPYLAGRHAVRPAGRLRKAILTAFAVNLLFVVTAAAVVLLTGSRLLHIWVGEEIARSAGAILAPIVWSFALLGLNVTGYYAMLAVGRVRIVTVLHLLGGTVMLLLMAWSSQRTGIRGIAMARLVYGGVSLLLYVPLVREIFSPSRLPIAAAGSYPVCEDA